MEDTFPCDLTIQTERTDSYNFGFEENVTLVSRDKLAWIYAYILKEGMKSMVLKMHEPPEAPYTNRINSYLSMDK